MIRIYADRSHYETGSRGFSHVYPAPFLERFPIYAGSEGANLR